MFPLHLGPGSKDKVRFWRIATGVTFTAGGGTSIAAIVPRIKEVLPAGMIIEQYTHMAAAAAFVAGLPLYFFPRVISISLAQKGVAASLILLGCSLSGAFPPNFTHYLRVLLGIVVCVLLVLFSESFGFFARQRSKSDVVLGIVLLIPFVYLWLYPIVYQLR
jgi:hypothetical protein